MYRNRKGKGKTMKKALILMMVMLMAFQGILAYAESGATEPVEAEVQEIQAEEAAEAAEGEAEAAEDEAPEAEAVPAPEYNYDELTIGSITPFEGYFSTSMWGNVTSDLDVRMLVHGYNLVEWRVTDSVFAVDPSVVSGIIVTENAAGDRTYTLTLYDDLYYSDGTQITARDYAFAMLLKIAPEITEIGGSVKPMDYLVGYADYISGAVPYLSGVRIISEDTLAITVSRDYLPFFYEMALLDCEPYPIYVIAPGCRVADDGNGIYIANEDANVQEPVFTAELLRETLLNEETGYVRHPSVSSGPYNLVSFDGETVELSLNEYYKGNSAGLKPIIPTLYVKTVKNEDMIEELSKGELGLINKVVSIDALQEGTQLTAGSDVFTSSNYPRSGMSFIAFSCEREPVNSVAVRQAIAMCLDKDGLVSDTVGNYGLRVDGYYGLGQWMYTMIDSEDGFPIEEPAEDADEAALAEYEEKVAEWQALTLENAKVYEFDVEGAIALLEGEGWTLNREGEAYNPETDDVRCKAAEDGTIQALELKMLCPEGSNLNAHYEANFVNHLAEAGIQLTVEEKPLSELTDYYYRKVERDYDLIALATNFDIVFDPSYRFRPDGEDAINPYNATALNDEQLYELAVDMRHTASDDPLAYCQKWIAFEERFQELEPMIPIYSNVYFDFYARVLHEYNVASSITWSQAIVGAYMSDVADDELAGEEGEEGEQPEGTIEIVGPDGKPIEING